MSLKVNFMNYILFILTFNAKKSEIKRRNQYYDLLYRNYKISIVINKN